MPRAALLLRSLAYYWRANLAVVLGVATAVAVLAGALVVGDSVRASLRDLVLLRLGAADLAVSSPAFFRADLADDVARRPRFGETFRAATALIATEGVVTHEGSGRRAGGVQVYGVDDRFWSFHGRPPNGPTARQAFVSTALADELGTTPDASLLVRLDAPADIPGASLFGRRDDLGRSLRVSVKGSLSAADLGEFALRPQQQAVRAVFVPLRLLERTLKQEGKANTLLLAEKEPRAPAAAATAAATALLREAATLEDRGLRLRVLPGRAALSLESRSALLSDALADTAQAAAGRAGLRTVPVLTYLANAIRADGRSVPYSLVTGLPPDAYAALAGKEPTADAGGIVLNDWAAGDLGVRPGAAVTLEYYVWKEEGRLETRRADFRLEAVVPLRGPAADRDYAPEYPGITESAHLSDWDPPFPIDLKAVRPRDEEYWDRYRTTPKAFVLLERAQQLWRHRLGGLSSIRFVVPEGQDIEAARTALETELLAAVDPARAGFTVAAVRQAGLEASAGATDFGEYFAYFSFFIVVSALLLASLFFRLGIEQRLRELGLLRALGFPLGRVRRGFAAEGLALAGIAALPGVAGALLYAGLMLLGLRTFWNAAVGTTRLALHPSAASLAIGAAGGIVAALVAIVWTLRGLERFSPRALLTETRVEMGTEARRRGRAAVVGALALAAAGLLLGGVRTGSVPAVAGFFAAGALVLVGGLAFAWRTLAGPRGGFEAQSVVGLGLRNAAYRPGRSLLSIALIASAAFLVVAIGAFRRTAEDEDAGPRSGTGGYPLLAESLLPLHHDPGTPEGRTTLGLDAAGREAWEGVRFERFRLKPGDDASCLNLYRPQNPRVLGVTAAFVREGRFAFQESRATTPEEKANPWLLLEKEEADGAIPVAADANSMTYVLQKKLGDTIDIETGGGTARLRLVAALADSLFQGELLMAERPFQRLFPDVDGYRFFLIEAPPAKADALTSVLEARLSDQGFDVSSTAARVARFHEIENTYLSTFQSLGGLGLLLGTLGLATVLVRNALEQRRSLALLQAVGYRPRHVATLVVAENVLLLGGGLALGTLSALVAVAPTVATRGGHLPLPALGAFLLAIAATGLLVSRLAVAVVERLSVLDALKAE
jgi:putative ABC transport system permease protein